MGHGVFWLAATEPCCWHLLALAQPPASCRLISRLHGSFGEHFFEGVDAFWGPALALALALAPALALGRQTEVLTRQDMGPRRSLRSTSGPNKKRYSLLRRQSSSPSSPPDSPGEWESGDFRHLLHQAPRKLGEVPSSSRTSIFFPHGKPHHSLARLQDRLFIQCVLPSDVIPGLSSLRLGMGPDLTHTAGGTRRSCARRLGRLTGTSSMTDTMSGSLIINLTQASFPRPCQQPRASRDQPRHEGREMEARGARP